MNLYFKAVSHMSIWGLGSSGVLGSIYGTILIPIVGTVVGAAYGGVAGFFLGGACGLLVGFITHRHRTLAGPQRYRIILGASTALLTLIGSWLYFSLLFAYFEIPSASSFVPALLACLAAIYASQKFIHSYLPIETDQNNTNDYSSEGQNETLR